MRYLVLMLIMLALPVVCSAEIYKWVDEKGQTGFSDDLGKVPKRYRDNAVVTEKQEQAVEIVEKTDPEKSPRKGSDGKAGQSAAGDDKPKGKDKPLYDGRDGDAWKQDFSRLKYELKSMEDQSSGLKERMANPGKVSRGEYLTLQNTQRDLEVRMVRAKKKLDALNDAAEKAGVPAEFR